MRKFFIAAGLGLALAMGALAVISPKPALSQAAQCGRTAVGSSAAATTLIVAGATGGTIHLCGWDITASATATFQLVTGTGATCGTNTVNITAAHAVSPSSTLATSGATPGRYSAPAGNGVCVIVTGTGPVQWTVYYTQLF